MTSPLWKTDSVVTPLRRIFCGVLLAGICCDVPTPWIFYGVHSRYMLGVPIAVNILGCPQWVYAGVCLSPSIF